jgi:GNAT superfamily N-acetyltransferase
MHTDAPGPLLRHAVEYRHRMADPRPDSVSIRPARPDDCAGICAAHLASIRGLCARDYTPEEIESWCLGKTPDVYAPLIERYPWLVAEIGGRIVGFGELDAAVAPETAEIRGLYLAPEAVGCGIGRALVERLLAIARAAGARRVILKGTLTAEVFYQRMGFRTVQRATHRSHGGLDLACVAMEMPLA